MKGFLIFVAVILVLIAAFWVTVGTLAVKGVQKVDANLEQNDTTLAKEAGKFFGKLDEQFQEGVDEAKD